MKKAARPRPEEPIIGRNQRHRREGEHRRLDPLYPVGIGQPRFEGKEQGHRDQNHRHDHPQNLGRHQMRHQRPQRPARRRDRRHAQADPAASHAPPAHRPAPPCPHRNCPEVCWWPKPRSATRPPAAGQGPRSTRRRPQSHRQSPPQRPRRPAAAPDAVAISNIGHVEPFGNPANAAAIFQLIVRLAARNRQTRVGCNSPDPPRYRPGSSR